MDPYCWNITLACSLRERERLACQTAEDQWSVAQRGCVDMMNQMIRDFRKEVWGEHRQMQLANWLKQLTCRRISVLWEPRRPLIWNLDRSHKVWLARCSWPWSWSWQMEWRALPMQGMRNGTENGNGGPETEYLELREWGSHHQTNKLDVSAFVQLIENVHHQPLWIHSSWDNCLEENV